MSEEQYLELIDRLMEQRFYIARGKIQSANIELTERELNAIVFALKTNLAIDKVLDESIGLNKQVRDIKKDGVEDA